MKFYGKIAAWVLGIFLFYIVVSFGLRAFNIVSYQIFAPWKKDVQREVWENTQQRVEGKRQELAKKRLEYVRLEDEKAKEAIRYNVVSSFSQFDIGKVKVKEDSIFLAAMRNGKQYTID